MTWPRIVAEALRTLSHPASLRPREAQCIGNVTVDQVLAEIRAPARTVDPVPSFLLPAQRDPWRRAIAALALWKGAIVAEGVGLGKTWIALGVAAHPPYRATTTCIVPSALLHQWETASRNAGIRVSLWTHERISRGALPPGNPTLIVVDEAHRFREIGTRRVRTLAPWLVGRSTLLLTATPIVNRLADLTTLLRLAFPDDALALDGIRSLAELESMATPPQALRRLVIRSVTQQVPVVARNDMHVAPDAHECARGEQAVEKISKLRLSAAPGTRRLMQSVLLDAAASSNVALRDVLTRYRGMLRQAADGGGCSRSELRRFAGAEFDQTVMWTLLGESAPDTDAVVDLPLDDLATVNAMLAEPATGDRWVDSLRAHADEHPVEVWFARHRATARLLRQHFGDETAWVAGSDAGIGPHRMGRGVVLGAFGPSRATWTARKRPPCRLVATDVVAEGLDLQSATRIVHADLPWTAARLDQREGRLIRLGQRSAAVDVVRRRMAPAIERALAPEQRIQRKRKLAELWTQALERADAVPMEGDERERPIATCCVIGHANALHVGVRTNRGARYGLLLLQNLENGGWKVVNEWATASGEQVSYAREPNPAQIPLGDVTGIVHGHVGQCDAGRMALIERVHRLARRAARHRDGAMLGKLDRTLRFLSASPTLGARMLQHRLARADDREFVDLVVPDAALPPPLSCSIRVVIVVRSRATALR